MTLVTGDVVGLQVSPDGRQAAWLIEPATPASRPPAIYQQDGRVHVVPAEAGPYLASGVLDPRLFDVSYLAGQGYDDASRADLPLQFDYRLDTDAHNQVPAGIAYPLLLAPGYQPGGTGPGGFVVTAEVSYDDGQSWTTAPVAPGGAMLRATVPAAPAGAGFASLRMTATDLAGNRLTQQIDRAWRIQG